MKGPEEADKEALVPVPGAQASDPGLKGAGADAPLKEALSSLASHFSPADKPSFHSLPVPLCWQLWTEVYGWRGFGAASFAKLEVGVNGHYHSLVTESCRPESPGSARVHLPKPARQLMTVYHLRREKLRIAVLEGDAADPGAAAKEVGYCNFRLKDLEAGKPRVGWVQVKNDVRDAAGKRTPVGTLHLGLLLSPTHKASCLFLLDMRDHEALFFLETETLRDLNPAFDQPSMTPFRWEKSEKGTESWNLSNNHGKHIASVTANLGTQVVDIVRLDQDEYWQCSVTNDVERKFRVDGSWSGRVHQTQERTVICFYLVKASNEAVAHAEWRNARDLKLSVDDPMEDPLNAILIFIAIHQLKQGKMF